MQKLNANFQAINKVLHMYETFTKDILSEFLFNSHLSILLKNSPLN